MIAAVLLFLAWLSMGEFRFLFWRFPSLTGFPFGNRTYLVLFQNNYELRPTGGFISTYGELHFSHGLYTGLDFYDVYGSIDDHDYVAPPLVMGALLSGEGYQGATFRDANFDPDFRLSKDELIRFYQMTNPDTQIDGVVAADFTFLEELVGLYEPLEVDGYSLTQKNLFETLSSAVSDIDRHNEEALANRKNITGPLVKSIITKSVILPWRLFTIRDLVAEGFEEKHLLAAFNRSGLQSSFHYRAWDGALPQSDLGDFLVVNEGNFGGMKSDRYITRDIRYELDILSQSDVRGNPVVDATVTVTLSHEGGYNTPLSGPYKGYLRTMIPLGSDIVQGASVTEDRDDVYVLGEMVEMAPGESVSYTYKYRLPEYVWSNGTYYLHLQKQPGTNADDYKVVVRVPQGMSIDSEEFSVRENVAFFGTNLNKDTNLNFSLAGDENPPRIVSHEITAMNEVTVVFNESLNVEHAGDPMNYQVMDMNYANADITDEIHIDSIRVDGSAVILTLSGMTEQPEERYELKLRGITDTHGNDITPDPRTVTVVQRAKIEDNVINE